MSTKPNYVRMNFQYFLDSLNYPSVDAFEKDLYAFIQSAPEDEWKKRKVEFDMDIKTMRKMLNDEEYHPGRNIVMTLKRWFEHFLHQKVSLETLTGSDVSMNAVNWESESLEGTYVGTYLDPTASGEIKIMYLELKKDESEKLSAYIIHNLRDLDFLQDKTFFDANIEQKYEALKRRGSRLLVGSVNGNGNTVVIEAAHKGHSRHKMTLYFDVSNYLRFCQEEKESRKFQGGLGFQVILDDIRITSPYVTRVGLIRTDSCANISLQDEQIKNYLAVTPHETAWGPLRLNLDRDGLWFEWFMKKYEETSLEKNKEDF